MITLKRNSQIVQFIYRYKSEDSRLPSTFCELIWTLIGLILMNICVGVFFGVAILLYIAGYVELVWSIFRGYFVLPGLAFTSVGFTVVVYFLLKIGFDRWRANRRKNRKIPKRQGLIYTMWWAWKEKVCPIVQYDMDD